MPTPRPDLPSAHDLAIAHLKREAITPECRDAAIALLRSRAHVGLARYGQPLTAHNGRDGRRDAAEEAADLFVYLQCGAQEGWATRRQLVIAQELLLGLATPVDPA